MKRALEIWSNCLGQGEENEKPPPQVFPRIRVVNSTIARAEKGTAPSWFCKGSRSDNRKGDIEYKLATSDTKIKMKSQRQRPCTPPRKPIHFCTTVRAPKIKAIDHPGELITTIEKYTMLMSVPRNLCIACV
jgi:hypothetical protein